MRRIFYQFRKTLPWGLASNRFVLKITRFESELFVLSLGVRRLKNGVKFYFFSPKRLTPDPPDQNEKNILPVPENSTVGFSELGLYSRVISVTSRYFGLSFEYNVAAPPRCRATTATSFESCGRWMQHGVFILYYTWVHRE